MSALPVLLALGIAASGYGGETTNVSISSVNRLAFRVQPSTFSNLLVDFPHDPGVRERLLALLGPESAPQERVLAVCALGGLSDLAWCLPALTALQEDRDPQVRGLARWAVGRTRGA